ncbi:MAG: PepSY-associated TM helix domain-containing protein, partial [Candidatus Dadabacteria bacterium]|nr:PepSY-associated TM helix domain-containing protein [Candidatus Dadabacteria bacterium]
RKLNIAVHRDLGYFFSSLVIAYCISGIALNHINDWNPDFIIHKETVKISEKHSITELNDELIGGFGKLVGEESFKVYDMPTSDQVKIYYDNGSLHLNFSTGTGVYEKLHRRPLFYHVNALHRNSVKGWKWASDVFAVMLITINITG